MSKIAHVHGGDGYKLLIDFDDGSSIVFNMQKMIKTFPYLRLNDLSSFQAVKFDEKSVFWEPVDGNRECFPLRLTVDNILFSIRD